MYTVETLRNGKVWTASQFKTLKAAKKHALVQNANALDSTAYTTVFPSVPAGLPAGTVSTEILFRVDYEGEVTADRYNAIMKAYEARVAASSKIHFIMCR
jgi:hypothetical protein